MDSISIKSYFERNGEKEEIRRFVLELKVPRPFDILIEKLDKLYGENLKALGFVVLWKDEDGDEISLSSQEELQIAIQALKSDVLKLYIKKSPKTAFKEHNADVHPGVMCDGCDHPLRGFRYKCMQCPDYDLCSTCESKNMHPKHMMIRIPTPTAHGFPFGPWMYGGRGMRHRGCGGFRRHGFKKYNDPGQQQEADGKPNGGAAFNLPYMLENVWKTLFRNNPMAAEEMAAGANCSQPSDQKPEPNVKPDQTNANANSGPNDQPDPRIFLQSIGETVAQLLDPLGIDVTIDVEHKGEKTRCNADQEDKNKEAKQKQGDEAKDDSLERNNAKGCDNAGVDGEKTDSENVNENKRKEQTPEEKNVENGEAVAPPTGAEKMSFQDIANEVVSSLTEAFAATLDSSPSDHSIIDGNEWTYLDYTENDTSPRQFAPEHTEVKQVAGAESIPSHSDPAIANSLKVMTEMGYSNENGWLTGLLELSDGDVNRTIENINALREKGDRSTAVLIALVEKCKGNIPQLMLLLQSLKNAA